MKAIIFKFLWLYVIVFWIVITSCDRKRTFSESHEENQTYVQFLTIAEPSDSVRFLVTEWNNSEAAGNRLVLAYTEDKCKNDKRNCSRTNCPTKIRGHGCTDAVIKLLQYRESDILIDSIRITLKDLPYLEYIDNPELWDISSIELKSFLNNTFNFVLTANKSDSDWLIPYNVEVTDEMAIIKSFSNPRQIFDVSHIESEEMNETGIEWNSNSLKRDSLLRLINLENIEVKTRYIPTTKRQVTGVNFKETQNVSHLEDTIIGNERLLYFVEPNKEKSLKVYRLNRDGSQLNDSMIISNIEIADRLSMPILKTKDIIALRIERGINDTIIAYITFHLTFEPDAYYVPLKIIGHKFIPFEDANVMIDSPNRTWDIDTQFIDDHFTRLIF